MVYNESITLDLNTNTSYIVVGAKQGDSGRAIIATIMENNNLFSIPQNAVAFYRIRKANGEGVWSEATINRLQSQVNFTLNSYDLAEAGRNFVDIIFIEDEVQISTVSFIIDVQPVPNILNSTLSAGTFEYFQIQNFLFSNDNGNLALSSVSPSEIQRLAFANTNDNLVISEV